MLAKLDNATMLCQWAFVLLRLQFITFHENRIFDLRYKECQIKWPTAADPPAETKQKRWRILAKYFQSSIIFFPTCTTLHAQSLGEMQGGHQQYAALMQHCSCCRCCCFKKLVSRVLVSWISAAQRLIGIRRLSEGHRLDSWWVRTQNIFFRATFLTKSEAVVIFPRLAPVTCFHRVLIGSLRICVWRDWPDLISF